MSLKSFHIAFIAVSSVMCFGVAGWGIWNYLALGEAWALVFAALSVIFGVGLILYGIRFLRKLRHVSFL